MNTAPATNAYIQMTIGRIAVLTELRKAETTAAMSNLWLKGSNSAFTNETPGAILRDLTGAPTCMRPDMNKADRTRQWIADQVSVVEPILTQSLIDHADSISRDVVKRSPAEFMALKDAWKYNVIDKRAGHLALERAAAVYPKSFPEQRMTFLADLLTQLNMGMSLLFDASRVAQMAGPQDETAIEMYSDAFTRLELALQSMGLSAALNDHTKIHSPMDLLKLAPEIQETINDRFSFIVNHVRDKRILAERFGLTESVVRTSLTSSLLSANPFEAIERYKRKSTWLKVELGATLALVAGLTVGGFVSHLQDEVVLRNLLWILDWSLGLGFTALSGDRYLKNRRSELIS